MNHESAPSNEIKQWKGLEVGKEVVSARDGWGGILLRLQKDGSTGRMVGTVQVTKDGKSYEMEEFASHLDPASSEE